MPLVQKNQDETDRTTTGLPVDREEETTHLGVPGADVADVAGERADSAAAAAAAEARVPEQSRAEWKTSFDAADFPVPQGREEAWRFTPVDRLRELLEDGTGHAAPTVEQSLPQGVTVSQIDLGRARELGAPAPADRAAALAATNAASVLHVDVPADATPDGPVRLDLTAAADAATFGHVLVTVGTHAKVTVVLGHTGPATFSELVSVITGDGSDVTLVTLQEWDDDARHLGEQDVVVGRDATVRHIAVTVGGAITRVNTNASYAGPGGSFTGLGVYFADAGQHLEHRLFVDHEAPHCVSEVEYKGALQGDSAHTVWVGDVLIRAAAEGTDTYELNRNLVLTDGARADSVPNLEIETGRIVGAGHASATGRFEDSHLFYLQSRGIPEAEARRLVVRGFFAEIIAKIGVPDVTEHLMQIIDDELSATLGTGATDETAR